MNLSSPSRDQVRKGLGAVLGWIVSGGLLVALIVTLAQCQIAREDAHHAAIQTYNLGRIATFRDSGADLDKKIAAYNDAAAEGRDVTDDLTAVRAAFADHAARTVALDDVFGPASKRYLGELKLLQSAVEDNKDGHRPGPVITEISRVNVARNKLVKDAAAKSTA